MIFDRNKGAIYSIYNRALRQNPTLQGKVVLQLTITPLRQGYPLHGCLQGTGRRCAGSRNRATRRSGFDFAAEDVNGVTITYPIDFLPA